MVGEVLVVCGGAREQEEGGVSEQRHAVLHADDHLLPHPLGHQAVAQQDHGRARHKPHREEQRELVVEPALELTNCGHVVQSTMYKWSGPTFSG